MLLRSIPSYFIAESEESTTEADLLSAQVLNGSFQPSVDIFIPTYDEPVLFCDARLSAVSY